MRVRGQTLACLICGGDSRCEHFGAQSCRACAAFFRRTVVNGTKYVCRKGNACRISQKVRCVCRACRFRKCMEVGMREGEVEARLHESQCASQSEPENEPLGGYLSKFLKAYDQLMKKRKTKKTPRRISFKEAHERYFADYEYLRRMLFGTFDEIKSLPANQEKLLYEQFFLAFQNLEMAVATSRKLTSEPNRFFHLATSEYIDIDSLDTYATHGDGSANLKAQELKTMTQALCPSYVRSLIIPLASLKITNKEFLGLTALVYWSCGHEDLSFETEELAHGIRQRVMTEMLTAMREDGVTEPGRRLSEIILIMAQLHHSVHRLQGIFELQRLCDIYRHHEGFYRIICSQHT